MLFGSPVGELTLATLVSVPLAGAVTVTVTLLTWPFAKVPKLQLTTPLVFTPLPLALTNVTPGRQRVGHHHATGARRPEVRH